VLFLYLVIGDALAWISKLEFSMLRSYEPMNNFSDCSLILTVTLSSSEPSFIRSYWT